MRIFNMQEMEVRKESNYLKLMVGMNKAVPLMNFMVVFFMDAQNVTLLIRLIL